METQGILTERNIVVEVLEKYRQLPYLWNPTHKLYTIKSARRQGLESMLQIWKKLEPKANVDCMKKKLNNWRSAYRRERKKVEDSLLTTSDPEEYHKPNLWYYDYLTFLHDDCPVLSNDEDEGGIESEISGVNEVDVANAKMYGDDNSEKNDGDDDDDEDQDEIEEEPEKKPRMTYKRKINNDKSSKPEEEVDTSQFLSIPNDESSADLFGRAIGSQLKEVSKFQRCLAERLISEIMFYAKLEQLTIGTSVNLESNDS